MNLLKIYLFKIKNDYFFISIKNLLKDKINILYNNRSLIYRMFKRVLICETGGHNLKNIENIGNVKNIIEGNLFKAPLELVGGENQVKPYFDFDPVENDDFDTEIFVMNCKQNIQLLFDLETDKDITYVNRQYPKNDKTKYSYHFMIDKNRISYFNIPELIKQKNMEEAFKDLGYDNSVYSKNRGLYPIYSSIKRTTDKSKPYIHLPAFKPENDDDISKYLITYIEEDFKDWDLKFPKKEIKPKKTEDDTLFNKAINITKNYCDDGDLILVRKLVLECLSYNRAENYDDWIKLGLCLRNIDYRLVDVWDEFSKNGSSYKSGECLSLWDKFNDNGKLTMGSLKYWAKNDNKLKYENLIEDSIYPIVDKSIRSEGAHTDVAEVMSLLFKDKMVYDTKLKSWFIVNNKTNIWEEDKEGVKVRLIISTLGCNLYIKRTQYWNTLDCEDELLVEVNKIKAKMSLKIASQLKNAGFKDSVMKELKSWCVQDDFVEKYLDSNINLFAFKNGVYDLEKNEFRNIEPNDYIMSTCDYKYDENVDVKYTNKILKVLSDIQNETDKYNYMIDIISLCLYGKNIHSNFNIFTGVGANGKSVLGNLLQLSFGSYFKKVSSDLFTKKTNSINSTSDVANLKSCRIVLFEEPEEDEVLQAGTIKDLTGDASVTARGLFKEPITFIPQFNIFGNMNEIPKISKVEPAVKRRLKILSFTNKFVQEPKMPNEKLIDLSLNSELSSDDGFKNAFMQILINNWNSKNLKKQLDVPDAVKEMTDDYMDDNDFLKDFMSENYEKTNNIDDKIKSSDLYNDYKIYLQYKHIKPVTVQSFKNSLINLGYIFKKEKDSAKWLYIIKKEHNDEE
jgi:P4 family phage/plasmid primase-like protien